MTLSIATKMIRQKLTTDKKLQHEITLFYE